MTKINVMDELEIKDALTQIDNNIVIVANKTKGEEYRMIFDATDRQRNMIRYGGLLNLVKRINN